MMTELMVPTTVLLSTELKVKRMAEQTVRMMVSLLGKLKEEMKDEW